MILGGGCTYSGATSQLAAAESFLATHAGQVAFITIDIGANDITSCFSASGVNQACAQTASDGVVANLTTILNRLRAAGGAVPIFGMTYYDPFLAYWVGGNQNAAIQSEQVAVAGNARMTGVYQAAGAQVADVQTTFDTTNFAMTGSYNGTTVPQNVANICAWTLMCALTNIHANATGYQLIANTFEPLIDATVSP
jgi:lysophospholipase L1-like esterase